MFKLLLRLVIKWGLKCRQTKKYAWFQIKLCHSFRKSTISIYVLYRHNKVARCCRRKKNQQFLDVRQHKEENWVHLLSRGQQLHTAVITHSYNNSERRFSICCNLCSVVGGYGPIKLLDQ